MLLIRSDRLGPTDFGIESGLREGSGLSDSSLPSGDGCILVSWTGTGWVEVESDPDRVSSKGGESL